MLLAACIVIPLPQGEGVVSEGREIAPGDAGTIALGRMSRPELVAALGEPAAIWEERRVLIYAWDRVQLKLLWIIAGGMRAAGGIVDVPTHHLLLVQLDDHDVVTRAERCTRPMHEGFGDFLRTWADGRRCS
ncbi:hypothetical protein [Elioraea sp.]|uniref:hypothetical protein n=1 Tax=Elioraea sp. TaxID=2185103 RepID=UPI0025C40DE7|nr:hypothetical protein [Elioraea sp.]